MVVEDYGRNELKLSDKNGFIDSNSSFYFQNVHKEPYEDNNNDSLTPVQKFYEGRNVLITGATGFLGRILVEKLLRSCPTISTLYLIVRSKKGKNMDERVDELFEDVVFDRLKKECPKFRHKIVGISGDCALSGLGLNIEDRKRLIEETDILFHVAATVRFDEKLKTAVAINLRCPRDMVKMAKEMTRLKSFVHVSTIYANCLHDCIEEKIYPPAMDPHKLILLAENLSDKVMEDITPTLVGEYPNTYTYTKQVAEGLVVEEAGNMPLGVFRPAIVVSTYQEPMPAWINNLYGPTGVIIGAGVGLLRTLHCDPNVNANLVPVDMCVNSLIVAAKEVADGYQKASEQQKPFDVPVYNYGSSNEQPLDWRTFRRLSSFYGLQVPTTKAIWYYSFHLYKYYLVYTVVTFLLHTLPALLADGALVCMGKKPRMRTAYQKVHKFSKVIAFFATQEWKIKTDNVTRQQKHLGEEDRKIFFSDLLELDWERFFKKYCEGARIYLLDDPIDTLEKAKVNWRRFYIAHQVLKVLGSIGIVWLIWWLVQFLYFKI